jgi:hypothetical protein
MALKIQLPTLYGETRNLYVRVNNVDQLTNHDEAGPDAVRFRGYLSEKAFDDRAAFVWELVLPCKIDVSKPAWPQAYAALKAHDPTADVTPARDKPLPPEPLSDDAHPREVAAHKRATFDYEMAQRAYEADAARFDTEAKAASALKSAIAKAKDA